MALWGKFIGSQYSLTPLIPHKKNLFILHKNNLLFKNKKQKVFNI